VRRGGERADDDIPDPQPVENRSQMAKRLRQSSGSSSP
jgi:hypothetical protein